MIVVIGAGLIGLSVAYELAKRGAEVRVLESGDSAASPSWAAAVLAGAPLARTARTHAASTPATSPPRVDSGHARPSP